MEKVDTTTHEQKRIDELEQQLEQMQQQHEAEKKQLQFQAMLSMEIYKVRGRNEKAISALLDMEQLQTTQQPHQDIAEALQQLKEENGYLFEEQTPAMYAMGTGVQGSNMVAHNALRAAFGLPL